MGEVSIVHSSTLDAAWGWACGLRFVQFVSCCQLHRSGALAFCLCVGELPRVAHGPCAVAKFCAASGIGLMHLLSACGSGKSHKVRMSVYSCEASCSELNRYGALAFCLCVG